MKRNYIIGGVIVIIILAVGVYFQIQDNQRMDKNLPSSVVQNMSNQNASSSASENPPVASDQGQLQKQVLQAGSGPQATSGDVLAVNYVGTLASGTVFDSNESTSSPFTFTLGKGQVIPGWDQGLLGAQAGEKIKLTIPPSLAYGANGVSGVIPANATLTFDITVLSINGK